MKRNFYRNGEIFSLRLTQMLLSVTTLVISIFRICWTELNILAWINFHILVESKVCQKPVLLCVVHVTDAVHIGVKSEAKDTKFSSKAYGTRENKAINMEGRLQLDMLQVMQRDYKLRSYTLNSVCAQFLGKYTKIFFSTQLPSH